MQDELDESNRPDVAPGVTVSNAIGVATKLP